MNTPAHLILAAAVFAKPHRPKITTAAILGGFWPDFSLYALIFWSRFVNQNSFDYIFNTQYFSSTWQSLFAIDNSFFVWGTIILAGVMLRKPLIWVFGGAGFLHLCFDFPFHHDDARMHFWPFSDWVFNSPLSYWDHAHHGELVSTLEMALCAVLLVILWRRFSSLGPRALILFTATVQFLPIIMFRLTH